MNENGNVTMVTTKDIEKLLLPLPKIRKGTKAKPSVPHEDKRKKEKKHKSKEILE